MLRKKIAIIALLIPLLAMSKVYDCFTFFNENVVTEVRLAELYDVVDHFVIVEAKESHRGLPKPLNFDHERFAKYADKIIYIPLDNLWGENSFNKENYQKNAVMMGLKGRCSQDDIILFSDVDEIPPKELVQKLDKGLQGKNKVIGFKQKMYRHHFNRFAGEVPETVTEGTWVGTIAMRYSMLENRGKQRRNIKPQYIKPNSLRISICFEGNRNYGPIWEGGWHFTSMGPYKNFREKYENWVHWKNPFPRTVDKWRGEVTMGRMVPIDETFPQFVQDNVERFLREGFICFDNDEIIE